MAWETEHTSLRENGSEDRSVRAVGRRWRTLQQRADFLRVRAAEQRRVTPGFVLQAAPVKADAPSHDGQCLRIGFTASKKVGNAVARNRAKRRLRALADKVMASSANPAFDYVLIGRAETLSRNFALMESELRRALQRVCTDTGRRRASSTPQAGTP